MNMDIFRKFLEHHIGHELEQSKVVYLTASEVLEAIFRINHIFKEKFNAIKATPYDSSFEKEADDAILSLAFNPESETWEDVSQGA